MEIKPEQSLQPETNGQNNYRLCWWAAFIFAGMIGVLGAFMTIAQLDEPDTTTPDEDPDQPPKESRTFLAHLLVGALIFTTLFALADACRAHWAISMSFNSKTQSSASSRRPFHRRPPLSQQCSLVDLTMSRHERRESAANQHHKPVLLPESCDPPSTSVAPATFRCVRRRPIMARHPSMSMRSIDDAIPGTSSAAVAAVLRRSSSELSDGEASPDSRRRCSRLIRRH